MTLKILLPYPQPVHYGTNTPRAWSDDCPHTGDRHAYRQTAKIGKLTDYCCIDCGATTSCNGELP